MKTKITKVSGLFALSQLLTLSVMAQTASTTSTPSSNAPALSGQSTTNTESTAAAARPRIGLSYLGILFGPNLSDGLEGQQASGAAPSASHRPNLSYRIGENSTLGLQARYSTSFVNQLGIQGANQDWRVYFIQSNVYQKGIFGVTLMGRAVLPTSNAAHNRKMTVSPEFMPIFGINPKNSRFSFSVTPQVIPFLYSDKAVAGQQKAPDVLAVFNLEGTYNLGATTQLTFAYYPEYTSTYAARMTNTSNEVDLGVNWNVTKDWSVNPVIATEMNGLGVNGAALTKNMQFNMSLSGRFL